MLVLPSVSLQLKGGKKAIIGPPCAFLWSNVNPAFKLRFSSHLNAGPSHGKQYFFSLQSKLSTKPSVSITESKPALWTYFKNLFIPVCKAYLMSTFLLGFTNFQLRSFFSCRLFYANLCVFTILGFLLKKKFRIAIFFLVSAKHNRMQS